MIGTLGSNIVFRVSDSYALTFNGMTRDVTSRWAVHETPGIKPKPEFLGPGLQTISLPITLSASLGVRPRSVLESIEGSDIVEKIVVRNVKTNEKREIPLSGVFIFIGTLPNDEYVHDLLQKDEGGWIVTDASLQTSVPGIFAAGDVRDTSLRQVVTAAGDGARAAMSAYAYLQR